MLMAFVAGNAQAPVPQDARQSIIVALENAWNHAAQGKDVKALDRLLADELIYIEYNGTEMSKAQYLTSVTAPALHFDHIGSESMKVQSYGNSAVVVGIYREKGVENSKPYLRRERFVDTWISRNGVWVCVASQSTLMLR
jgi:ketosteroid isomerase-like protein